MFLNHFSTLGAFELSMWIWRNLKVQNTNSQNAISRWPSKELVETLGSAEPWLENTDLKHELEPIEH